MTRENIPTVYDPATVETKWYKKWEEDRLFHAEPTTEGKHYSIVIPPPNVTGQLHMGHALDNTLQDILIRWRRMQGYDTLWMPGCDHAGIATQIKVEEVLAKEGISRYDIGRDKFIERVWEWKNQYGDRITNQLKRLGASCDWERERFTMDEGCSKAVREVFVSLFEKGLIYQGDRITNWCPRCNTALSDIEVEHEDSAGKLYHVRYPLQEDPTKFVTVATTRPETILGKWDSVTICLPFGSSAMMER
ncbi:MAG: Valyl-tRNA synthetase [Firmicutes bacterium]|nr:Valyl-tRNA synthetase [Bacillota bacterium]